METVPGSFQNISHQILMKNVQRTMHPDRAIAPQSSKSADISIFHEFYTAITL